MAKKIYYNAPFYQRGIKVVYVAPAAIDGTARVPEWTDAQGNPVNIQVVFRNCEAEVDDALARFMLHHKLARATKPALLEAA